MGWPPTENISPPPISTRWQEELTRIGGLAPNGLPMFRLVWGQTATFTKDCLNLRYLHHKQRRLSGWTVQIRDDQDNFVETRSFGPVLTPPRVDPPEGQFASEPFPVYTPEEVGVPRWLIEQYLPPERLGDWEHSREQFKSEHGFDGMGPYPREGFYWFAFHCIVNHQGACCKHAALLDQRCFGGTNGYRAPSEIDMRYIEALWNLNKRDTYPYHWTEAPTQEAIAQRTLMMFNDEQERLRKERDVNRDRIRQALEPAKKRLTSEGHGLDLVRFHDLGKALTEIRTARGADEIYAGPKKKVLAATQTGVTSERVK